MRLGCPLFADCSTPEKWIAELHRHDYSAAYCPLKNTDSDETVRAYAEAAKAANIVIAEVGAWSNPLSTDEKTRREAIALCQAQLALADRIGARCCVNISGFRAKEWQRIDPVNLSRETFDLIVETVRAIIDAVRPVRSFYALETMPWLLPDSVDSYVSLLKAIDRKQFAAHFDPVNLVSSPQIYYNNGALIREFVQKLGPHIRSCHAKDILLSGKLTVHLDETRPGLGGLDYATYLHELSRLEADVPLMLEHLQNEQEYTEAADHIRAVARGAGVKNG